MILTLQSCPLILVPIAEVSPYPEPHHFLTYQKLKVPSLPAVTNVPCALLNSIALTEYTAVSV